MIKNTYTAIEVSKLLGLENNKNKVYEILQKLSDNNTDVYKDTSVWYYNGEWIIPHMDLITYILPINNPIFLNYHHIKQDGCTSDDFKYEILPTRYNLHKTLLAKDKDYLKMFNEYIENILTDKTTYIKEMQKAYLNMNKEAIYNELQQNYDNYSDC